MQKSHCKFRQNLNGDYTFTFERSPQVVPRDALLSRFAVIIRIHEYICVQKLMSDHRDRPVSKFACTF